MSTSIDQAFVKQFEREVHQAYQRQGSKLRPTVRVKNGVLGSSTIAEAHLMIGGRGGPALRFEARP